jgi:hypothetical protein
MDVKVISESNKMIYIFEKNNVISSSKINEGNVFEIRKAWDKLIRTETYLRKFMGSDSEPYIAQYCADAWYKDDCENFALFIRTLANSKGYGFIFPYNSENTGEGFSNVEEYLFFENDGISTYGG